LHNIKELIDLEKEIVRKKNSLTVKLLRRAKEFGFSDRHIAMLIAGVEDDILSLRKMHNIKPDYKLVDTCAAEFEAYTPYYYSTYDSQ
jgi:carbamoyl-phosphate synthase large subunit